LKRYVHGVDQAEALLHAAFADEGLDGVGDIDEVAPVWRFEPEIFGQ
jgi:hypothetical protein